MTSKALARPHPAADSSHKPTDKLPVTLAVGAGIGKVIACFARPAGETDDDCKLVLHTWAELVTPFEPEVAVAALRSLLINNPRNPFRPSPQDLVERCASVRKNWASQARLFYYPGWCPELVAPDHLPPEVPASLLAEAQRDVLQRLKDSSPAQLAKRRDWWIARQLGDKGAEFSKDILAEYGVLTGAEFRHVDETVKVELEEARQRYERERWEYQERNRQEAAQRERQRRENLALAKARYHPEVEAALLRAAIAPNIELQDRPVELARVQDAAAVQELEVVMRASPEDLEVMEAAIYDLEPIRRERLVRLESEAECEYAVSA